MTETARTTQSKLYKPMRMRLKKWTRAEYDCMVAKEILTQKDKVELIEGEIVQKMPQNLPHKRTIKRATRALMSLVSDEIDIAVQLPLALGDISEPEPDIALVVVDDDLAGRPETALLVVEIADSSLAYDRGTKAAMYAKAGIADYWIVNINERVVEVYRDPVKVNGRGRYQTQRNYIAGENITPLAFDTAEIAVADLLP